MSAWMRRTAGVLIATALTTLLVYGAVESFASSDHGSEFAESAGYSSKVCPATGCYAATCHATQGGDTGMHGRGGHGEPFTGELQ